MSIGTFKIVIVLSDKFNISLVITITTRDIFQYQIPAIVYSPNKLVITYQTSKFFKKLIKKKRDLNFSMQGDKDGLLDKIASHPFAFP